MPRERDPRGFDSETAIKLVKAQSGQVLTVRQLQAWHQKKVVVAEMRDYRGARLYGLQGIRQLCVVARLLKADLPPNRLGIAIRNIDRASKTIGKPWDALRIVTDGRSAFVVDGDKGIEAVTGQVVSLILLGDLRRTAQAFCVREAAKMRAAF